MSLMVVSVFVNPTQFNNKQDLATYPRTEAADCRLLEAAGADVVGIKCEAEFGILIKALQKGNAQGVAQVPIAIEFVGTLGIKVGVREKLLTLCARFIDEFVGIDFIVEIPDKTRDRNVGFAHDSVGNGIAFIFVITHLVAVVHHQLMACEPGLCSSEACENVFRVHLRFASLHFSRVGDVAVVHNSVSFSTVWCTE